MTDRNLQDKLDRYEQALSFYADAASYIAPALDCDPCFEDGDDYMAPVDRDNGERARRALDPASQRDKAA